MARVADFLNRGIKLRKVRIGNHYAIKLVGDSFRKEYYVDLKLPSNYFWATDCKFFSDCLTTSESTVDQVLSELSHTFEPERPELETLTLNLPDAEIVKFEEKYAILVRKKIWWNPLSSDKYLDLTSADYRAKVSVYSEDFYKKCTTTSKDLVSSLYKACLRSPASKAGKTKITLEELEGADGNTE